MTPEQVYSALLRLYPKSFRQEYRATIVETFREMRRDTQLRPFRFWTFVIGDLCRAVWREYINQWTSGPGERRIGEFFLRETLMFNGYEDQVAPLYAGMDLRKYY